MALHLVQLLNGQARRVAKVSGDQLLLLNGVASVYELAQRAIQQSTSITVLADLLGTEQVLAYDPVHNGQSDWKLLPPVDVPGQPAKCMISGTGLTHVGSAKSRQAMHASQIESMTDSMKMFQWGLEGGNPGAGIVGIAPEWFYKGNGTLLRGHLDSLEVPFFAEDGGEEAEVAAIYIIDETGQPHRIGFAIGNEFSDHVFEKKNYLNLAGSKLRQSAIGPEIVITDDFAHLPGRVSIQRNNEEIWSASIETGESAMSHSLQNLEHHHFKFANHSVAGDLHVHYLGAATLSFSSGIKLEDGDWMEVSFEGFGRPLRNRVTVEAWAPERLITVATLA